MNLNNVWYQIDRILSNVEFNSLWKGFKGYNFALYDDEKVYFGNRTMDIDIRFIGNTSIDYNGEQIAIWHISEGDLDNIEVLTSHIVHEMFHAHQMENEEKRFPNDIKGLNVPFDIEYYNMKSRESELLKEAILADDNKVKLSNLIEIISIRDKRSKLYKDSTEYEFKIETIEGTAEYVGTKVLCIIDKNEYEKRMSNYLDIITDNNMIFNIRRFSYFYGTMLYILLDSLNIELQQEIRDNPKTIMEEIMNKIDKRINIEYIPIHHNIEENLNKYHKSLLARFEKFYNCSRKSHHGRFSIKGYDPMNMYRLGKEILHEHCVILYDNDKYDSLFIKGPVITVYNEDESQVINYITTE